MMTDEKKKKFKKLLTQRLDDLLEGANKTVSGMTDQRENFPDPTDRASMESERNFTLRIRDRERKLISKINEALERIDAGTYGICEECGEEISEKRLTARPVTTLCIDCKKRQENEERLKGL
jgi:DnaK suppressor protein